jgi:hypothetical protein
VRRPNPNSARGARQSREEAARAAVDRGTR